MPTIISHGTRYKAPFEGWYGECEKCGCEFRLNSDDLPYFSQYLCRVYGKDERVLLAKVRCPEYGCLAFAAVAPFVHAKTIVHTVASLPATSVMPGYIE